jgi:hypothetical protein
MKSVALFCVYSLALLNCYVWIIWPELFYALVWKWDIFIILMFAPLIYETDQKTRRVKNERTN